jgi:uncharacterized protein YhfF
MTTLPPIDEVLAKLAARGIAVPPGPVVLGVYGDSARLSEELLALIRKGQKRAGTSLLWAIEAESEAVPKPGDLEIVLDYWNEPALITRTLQVEVVAFSDVTAEYAAIEGEDDGSLASWRRGHWAFFTRECARIGREPSEDMPVVCSIFELLQVLAP